MSTTHAVKPGDCMTSLAATYKFGSYKTIHDDGENADYKKMRPSPARLVPRDTVKIPDRAEKQEPAPTAKSTKFQVAKPKARAIIDLRIEVEMGYELIVDGKDRHEGTADGKTPIEHPIAPDAAQGELWLWPKTKPDGMENKGRDGKFVIPILFGWLQPIDDPLGPLLGGVQGVLANLGHYAGPIDGLTSPEVEIATVAFRQEKGIDPTPATDTKLTDELKKAHG